MKLFLKICKLAGILIGIAGLCFVSHSAGMAKANDRTLIEEWKSWSAVEETVETPENEDSEDVVVTPEVEDEITAE